VEENKKQKKVKRASTLHYPSVIYDSAACIRGAIHAATTRGFFDDISHRSVNHLSLNSPSAPFITQYLAVHQTQTKTIESSHTVQTSTE